MSILNKVKCFIKKRDSVRSFPVNFAKILGTPILKDICEMLLPYIETFYEILIIKSSLLKVKWKYILWTISANQRWQNWLTISNISTSVLHPLVVHSRRFTFQAIVKVFFYEDRNDRSSRSKVFCKPDVSLNFCKIHREEPVAEPIF